MGSRNAIEMCIFVYIFLQEILYHKHRIRQQHEMLKEGIVFVFNRKKIQFKVGNGIQFHTGESFNKVNK